MTSDTREMVIKLQEAIGRSTVRLQILKEINKRESVKELIKRLGIPQPTVSVAITRFQSYGLIKLIKQKDNSQVYDRVPLLKQIGSLDKWLNAKVGNSNEEIKPKEVKAKPILKSIIPFIDTKIEENAKKMAEGPYFVLYLLENSIRRFIESVLSNKYGKDWWDKVVTSNNICSKVENRKKPEGGHKWHVPRGAHEIFYTDLADLTYFLNKEKNIFEKYLNIELWTTRIKIEATLSRNIVDHHNPLPQREINRLSQILEDWKRQIEDVKIK